MSLLSLSGVTVRYGRLTAVRGVTFTLAEGEMLFITGPNGAGKSSLLRAIAGVTRPPAAASISPTTTSPAARPRISLALAFPWCPRGAMSSAA